ncbi:MAG: 23S rRNA (adenine(2030)-N(6))-methyltransferase RlmJ [Deltaproteobacteria bacterium]|nr:23S rRNA (adenine(2030)-N(6))-methyltransferase RlmJ [Deltaproteobacteria bacterium]
MNYRHAFHAGNHADVLKHVVLLALLDALKRKDKPFFVLDTHAGRGRYSLLSHEAERTNEWVDGIARLIALEASPPPVHRFVERVRGLNREGCLDVYPGSPLLIAGALRESDRLAACELHPEEAEELRLLFDRDPRVGAHFRDGYEALTALLPPKERRGLVLIDPPYEAQEAELALILHALTGAMRRWETGIYAVWYPIKQRQTLSSFFRAVARLPAKSAFALELLVRPEATEVGLNGSGMLIINPPYKLDAELAPALPFLGERLAQELGTARFEWIKRERAPR